MKKEKEIEKYVKKEYKFSYKAYKIAEKRIAEKKIENKKEFEKAKEFLEMAKAYLDDSLHFLNKKDYIRAIACIYYAHAWLDAGARLGFWKPNKKEKKYFSVD